MGMEAVLRFTHLHHGPMTLFSSALKATLLAAMTLPAAALTAPGMAEAKTPFGSRIPNNIPNSLPKPITPELRDPRPVNLAICDWRVDWQISRPGDHMRSYVAKARGHSSYVAPGRYASGEYIRTKPILTNVGRGNCKPMLLTTTMGMKVDGTVGGPRSRRDSNSSVCLGGGPNREILPGGTCHGAISVIPAPCPIGGGYTYAKISWRPYQNSWTMRRNDPDGMATNRNHITQVKFTTYRSAGDSCR